MARRTTGGANGRAAASQPEAAPDKKYRNSRNTSRGVDKRERILSAGAQVLSRRRYVDTTLNEIAELSGTHSGSLYYYFDSREDLIVEVLTRGVQHSIDRVTELIDDLPPETTSLERLQVALVTHLHFMVESEYARAGVRGLGEVPPEMAERIVPQWRKYGAFFADLFDSAAADGYIRPSVDLHALRMLLFGAANWALEWFNPKGRLSIDEVAEIMLQLLAGVTQDPADAVPQKTKSAPARRRATRQK